MATETSGVLSDDYRRFADIVYTSLDDAVALLRERQSADLLSELEGNGLIRIPEVLKDRHVALIGRQLSTPNHETKRFLDLAARHDLVPVFWEYHGDKFIARNSVKYSRGRLGFYHGVGRNGGLKVEYLNVIDFTRSEGRAIRNVRTLWGQPLIDFHHDMLFAEYPSLDCGSVYDASAWFAQHGGAARHYYRAFITLFLRHAIWFEWFDLHGEELNFTREIFLPAYYDVYSTFGLRPLITPIEPQNRDAGGYWQLYPGHLRSHLSVPERQRVYLG